MKQSLNRKDYLASLITLYEAVGMTGRNEVVPQEELADNGQDVLQDPTVSQSPQNIQKMVNNAVDQRFGDEDIEEEPMEDTAYLQQPTAITPTESVIIEKQKFVQLFNLMKDLSVYSESYEESLSEVDLGLLDEKQLNPFRLYISHLREYTEKVKDYLINIFNAETYEKNLYAYVLFRTELTTTIKSLRQLLNFDTMDDDEFKKIKEKKIEDNFD